MGRTPRSTRKKTTSKKASAAVKSTPELKKRALRIVKALAKEYPDAQCALDFKNPYELLTATILSAQCTDARVNTVTPGLFEAYPSPREMAEAKPEELEEKIRSTGFFRQKAKSLLGCCGEIVEKFGGEVPDTMEDLTTLAGVGRKTANVVLGNCFGQPALTVDTHFKRLTARLELTSQSDPEKIEYELAELIPAGEQTAFSHRIILHGRAVCNARKPNCAECVLRKDCPFP